MWKWVGETPNKDGVIQPTEGLAGIPKQDLTDAEFKAYCEQYDAEHHAGALEGSGLYRYESGTSKKSKKEEETDAANEASS